MAGTGGGDGFFDLGEVVEFRRVDDDGQPAGGRHTLGLVLRRVLLGLVGRRGFMVHNAKVPGHCERNHQTCLAGVPAEHMRLAGPLPIPSIIVNP